MLIDDVVITVVGGKGGDGAVSFRQNEGNPRGGPDGGNGGNGGKVFFQGVDDITALQRFQFKKTEKADDGVPGKKKNLFGKNADDLIILLPLGTLVTNTKTDKSFEILDTVTKHQVARGGRGGKGNNEFKSATHQAPRYAEKGRFGETVEFRLQLRLIADVGFIGLPNAGKSSLLAVLTNAHPKIGDYPFTTLEPNLGVLSDDDNSDKKAVLADIPGLIEGASSGKGLGIKFLKHIEKTKLLVHCIDSSTDDILRVYETVRHEFSEYNAELLTKPEVILLTKTDLLLNDEEAKEKAALFTSMKKKVFTVSVYDDKSIQALRENLLTELQSEGKEETN